jgi:hypothetical protein
LAAHAQYGLVLMTNDNSSLVTNGLTMLPVSIANSIKCALYAAPDGTTDENLFVQVTTNLTVGSPTSGKYNGGYRSVPPYGPSNVVMLQVRAFEATYGTNYQTALDAPAMNGRRALVGKSSMARVTLGGSSPGPATPKVGPLVGPIILFPADGAGAVTSSDIAAAEGSNGVATATFVVRLTAPSTNEISVNFATQDGTALAGSDYESTNGTVVFAPGETMKSVVVTLLPDGPPEDAETFSLALSNPVNATLLRTTITCTIVEIRIYGLSVDAAVTFNTLSGRRYLLEKSADAISWVVVPGATNLLGTGTNYTFVDKGAGCSGLTVYRASLLP